MTNLHPKEDQEQGHRSSRALKACAEWLASCLSIGWPKDSLDDLEKLWWQYHDELKEFFRQNGGTLDDDVLAEYDARLQPEQNKELK